MNERVITQKVPSRNNHLFDFIFKNGNIDQILLCMNSHLFTSNADTFYYYLLEQSGLIDAKRITPILN